MFVAPAVLLLTFGTACTSYSRAEVGEGRRAPFRLAATTTGSATAPDALRVDEPADGYKPKVGERRARQLAGKPPSAPGDPSTIESFRLVRVTLASGGYSYSGTDPGPFTSTPTWVEIHLVPAGEHLPSSGACMPADAYRWAVLVNATTGAVAVWGQGFSRAGC